MENKITCPLCGENRPVAIKEIQHLEQTTRVRCLNCGLEFFSSDNYKQPKYTWDYNRYFTRPSDIRKAGIFAEKIANIVLEENKYPRTLEIGAATGLTAHLLYHLGIDVTVSEIDEQTCFYYSEHMPFKYVHENFVNDHVGKDYDLIYAGHTIEHIDEPLLLFQKIKDCLKPGGAFFFDTPDTFYAQEKKEEWRHYKTRNPYEHCCLYSARSILRIADMVGLNILKMTSSEKYESIEVLLEKPKGASPK